MTQCLFCGQREVLELTEVYADGLFNIETCCEGLYEWLTSHYREEDWVELLQELQLGEITGHRLRRVLDTASGLTVDYHLVVRPVSFSVAKAFVAAHHAHNAPPAGWRFGAAIWNGSQQVGVVIVGRPVARMIDHRTTVEVTRLCLRRDIADGLRWNACSQLYGWAAREARRRGFARIQTYTLIHEPGTSLVAAGWDRDGETRGGSWSSPSRPRADRAPTCPKVRWSKALAPMTRGLGGMLRTSGTADPLQPAGFM